MSNAVGDHDDAVGVDLLGPRGGHLTMQQARVDTDVGDLDVPVADHRSRRKAQGQSRLRHCKSEWKEGQAVGNPRSSALAWKGGVSAGTGDRKENKKDTPKWVLLAST